jgi:hypothetical protein
MAYVLGSGITDDLLVVRGSTTRWIEALLETILISCGNRPKMMDEVFLSSLPVVGYQTPQ